MENSCIEKYSWAKSFGETNNLTFDFQKIFSDLNKNSITSSELTDLKDSIINFILKENLKQQEIDIALKIYYKTLQKLNIKTDNVFFANFNESLHYQPVLLHAMLFTNFQENYPESQIKEVCNKVFLKSVEENSKYLITVLKTLNIFLKRYPDTIFKINLSDIYFCLQSNNGSKIRDEILQLFDNCLQKSPIFAYETFCIVLNNIPWTNKNKFYILSTILNIYSLESCKNMVEFKKEEFFEGVRLSLTFKHIFSAGQYLIKSLNISNNDSLLELLLKILESGTEKELINLNSQWWRYIKNKENLYLKLNIEEIFENIQSPERSFRYFLICYLFRNNIFKLHENIFSKILLYFVKNFKNWDSHVQLFIYKYVIESLPIIKVPNENISDKIYTVPDILNFIIEFFKINLFNSFPEFRQVILEKIPEIINFISKQLSRNVKDFSEKESKLKSIETFFLGIKDIFKYGISLTDYQPVIFALKLINLTIVLIYSKSTKNISKNCNILKNEKLSEFLNKRNIFDFQEIQINLLKLLNNESCEYDDVQLVIINTIKFIKYEGTDSLKILEECKQKCKNSDYNKCCTASLFASIIIDCDQNKKLNIKNNLYEFCFENIAYCLVNFENDPFFMCKSGYHLFGFVNCLNQIFLTDTHDEYNFKQYEKIVNACFRINNTIIKLLKLSSESINENTSASFEIMDESLEILLQKSKIDSQDHFTDRKFLLLSFWTTLKATCDIATTIGINLIKYSKENENLKLKLFEKCLDININVLQKCRHKGAIEAAGVSLGNLVKTTTTSSNKSKFYEILFKCFEVLFGNVSQNSLTRRGAGLSIMFHHLLKNDMDNSKLLFYHAIKILMSHVQKSETPKEKIILKITDNGENFDALVLHYLCVLVKDTELKGYVMDYYDDIMMAAIKRIEHREWCVRNAALQLFGGLTPKIVGQKQTGDADTAINWGEINEVTLNEIKIKLPKTLFYILQYCTDDRIMTIYHSNSTIILFLEFLSNIDYLKFDLEDNNSTVNDGNNSILFQYREIFWKFLSHRCEKVRKLAATCLIHFHNFSGEIIILALNLIKIFYLTSNPNFEQGIIFSLIEVVNKIKREKFLLNKNKDYLLILKSSFMDNYKYKKCLYYVRIKLLDLLMLLEFDLKIQFVINLIFENDANLDSEFNHNFKNSIKLAHGVDFGYYLWHEKVKKIYKIH